MDLPEGCSQTSRIALGERDEVFFNTCNKSILHGPFLRRASNQQGELNYARIGNFKNAGGAATITTDLEVEVIKMKFGTSLIGI